MLSGWSVRRSRVRRSILVVVGTVAALASTAAGAAAQSQLFVTDYERPRAGDSSISGPHPDGDRVVWAERRFPRMHLRSLATDGTVTGIGSVLDAPRGPDNPLYWDLAVGEGRLAFAQAHTECTDQFCRDYRITTNELHLGSIGGPYTLVASCQAGAPGCSFGPRCPRGGPKYRGLVLVAGMFSYSESCDDGRFVTRDLATGEEFSFPGSQAPHGWTGTGRYLAVLESDEPSPAVYDFVVYDVTTGQQLYRVEDRPPYGALGEDGLLAFFDPSSGQVSWADPSEPFLHPVARLTPTFGPELTVRKRTIAVVTPDSSRSALEHHVIDTAGNRQSQVDSERTADWGFDGRRLAWISEPCALAVIRIWDPGDDPPYLADARCPAAAVRDASSHVGRRGRIFVKARCPRRPKLGCSGTMRLVAKAGRRPPRRDLGEPTYAITSGDRERLKLKLSRKNRRFIRRHGTVRVVAISRAVQREGFDGAERRRFRFELKWRSR